MGNDIIAFHGNLQQLLEKVEKGEMVPKMQASHAPMCKFMTAFFVLNGIRHCVPLVHAPTGCAAQVSEWIRRGDCCEHRGVPLEPVPCTSFNESDVIYGGEGKLLEAVLEADKKYHPDLIVILSCCTAGIIGDDVETIAHEAEKLVNARVMAIKSEGFGGDFRSGYEDAFKLIMQLMEPPKKKRKGAINIIGYRLGPTATEIPEDLKEIERLLDEVGIKIHAEIAAGCTVEEIRRAREAELNASFCYDWGQKLGDLMKDEFGMPYSRTGLPYGLKATEEWLLGVAEPLGMNKKALDVIKRETEKILPELDYLGRILKGRVAFIEPTTVFNGPIRGLAMAKMVEEFGAHPIIFNIHPYTIKERMPSIKYLLETGVNPELILTPGVFRLGSYSEMSETEEELEKIVQGYDNVIYFGSSDRYPSCPVVNLGLISRFPRFGFRGIQNIAKLIETALKDTSRPRSRLFKEMIYG